MQDIFTVIHKFSTSTQSYIIMENKISSNVGYMHIYNA